MMKKWFWCLLLLSAPALAQFWQPADPTTATSRQAPPGESVKSYTEAPQVPRPSSSHTPRPTPTPPTRPVAIDPGPLGEKLATICFDGIRQSFYDPYSARMDRYQVYKLPDGNIGVVVMLNGKNRFGAYVGAKPYHCYKADGEIKVGEGEM